MADKYYRLVCFVVDICADVLRKYFVKLAKTDAGNTYTSVLAYLIQRQGDVKLLLQQKKIRQDQYNLMYPSNGNADENQWDITLIVTYIVVLFPIHETRAVSVIRDIRNELQHHPNTKNISDDEFDNYWEGLENASMHIVNTCTVNPKDKAAFQDKISKAKCNNLPNIGDCLRSWYEERIKQMESTINEMGSTIKQMESTTKETNCILRKVTVKKPGPSGDKNKRFKVVDGILAKLQKEFELSMKDFPDDFNAPNEVSGIRAILRDCHHVVVTGCNNSRYFETALAAIKGMDYNYKRSVAMDTSSDWRHIDPEDVDLVLCRDPFGGISYNESKAKAMDDIFKSMLHSTKRDNGDKALDIVIVTDLKILEECKMHHDHEILEEVVKVFTKTSSAQPADLTIGCGDQNLYVQQSLVSVYRNLEVMTKNFLSEYQVFSLQVDANVFKIAKEKFKTGKAVVLTGPKKCGKTSVAVKLASAYESSQCLLLKKPNDVNYIDLTNICLVIIDEFAGKYRYEKNDVYKWYNMFDHLYRAVMAGNFNMVITCEKGKLEKCINEIGRHAILDHVVDVPLQTIVVKSEVTERLEYGHVSGQLVTTDHSIGTISNITQSKNYTPQLTVVPSQLPNLLSSHNTMIPVSTGNTSLRDTTQTEGLEYSHVFGQLLDTNPSLDTISNTAQSKNYTTPLSVIPSQEPILRLISTENTSLQGIQNSMQLKRGLQSDLLTETIDLSVKRSRSMSSDVWSVEEKSEINIKINGDSGDCWIHGSCILPSGEILLTDYKNKKLKKHDNMYKVISVCDLPGFPQDVCYVGDNKAVVSQLRKLHFVDTKYSMILIRSIDTDHNCHGLACHGDQMYVRDIFGSVYSYSTDGIKHQMIYSFRTVFLYMNITVSNDGSKLYLPDQNKLVTIDNNGNRLFTLNNLDIDIPCGVCVDDQGYVYVNGRNGNILQISEDGRTTLQVITNVSGLTDKCTYTLTYDWKNKALIEAGLSNTIIVLKLKNQWKTQAR
ncbi:uncharacterized protein LOC132752119 isoform X2 [Ruditapes philippinarum]|uniref:uncharacterized protein LOC132752119 isoform X2 n=1 Tax=Ruditapes philippinarum TaxID=129788 RepID=UPI00295BB17C|nr:uncharacterized protein LOC132752119 isoform X2 [Ruditapes philippinarum]